MEAWLTPNEAAGLIVEIVFPRNDDGEILVHSSLDCMESWAGNNFLLNGALEGHFEILGTKSFSSDTQTVPISELVNAHFDPSGDRGNWSLKQEGVCTVDYRDHIWTNLKISRLAVVAFCEKILFNNPLEQTKKNTSFIKDVFQKELFEPLSNRQEIDKWNRYEEWSEFEAAFILNGFVPREPYCKHLELSWLITGSSVPDFADAGFVVRTVYGTKIHFGSPEKWRRWHNLKNLTDNNENRLAQKKFPPVHIEYIEKSKEVVKSWSAEKLSSEVKKEGINAMTVARSVVNKHFKDRRPETIRTVLSQNRDMWDVSKK